MQDELYKRAKAYENLLNYKYKIILCNKSGVYLICIEFKKEHFSHLAGLRKLKDLTQFEQSAVKQLENISDGKTSFDLVTKSQYFNSIKKRLEYMLYLENIIDSNKTVFKCNKNTNGKYKNAKDYSKIPFEYLLVSPCNNETAYVFINKKSGERVYFCQSFFLKEKNDYTQGQTNMTLLYKEKINITTKEKEILYNKINNGDLIISRKKAIEEYNKNAFEKCYPIFFDDMVRQIKKKTKAMVKVTEDAAGLYIITHKKYEDDISEIEHKYGYNSGKMSPAF